jgi:hypothetical protein
MPSLHAKWCRADPYDASMANLALARSSPDFHPPRPCRSAAEAYMVRRFVWQWFTCHGSKPSARAWARQLGISHVWLLKLVREFKKDPSDMLRMQAIEGDPKFANLERAREESQELRRRGELRPLRYRWPRRRRHKTGPR